LARGHHLHLVASLVEGDFGKEVLLLLKRVSDEGGNLWALIGHRKSPFAVVRQPCRTAHGIGDERVPRSRRSGHLWRRIPRCALLAALQFSETLIEHTMPPRSLRRREEPTLFPETPSRPSSPGIVARQPKRSGQPASRNTSRPLPDRRITLPHA